MVFKKILMLHFVDEYQYIVRGFSSVFTMHSAARALEAFCNHNSGNMMGRMRDDVLIVDAIMTHCWVPVVQLTVHSSGFLMEFVQRQEVLGQLLDSVERDFSYTHEVSKLTSWTGESVRNSIQRSTLGAISAVLAVTGKEFLANTTTAGASVSSALLHPLFDMLMLISSCVNDTLDSLTTNASEFVVVLGQISALVSRGFGVDLVGDLLRSGSGDLFCLMDYFMDSSWKEKVIFSLNSLSIAVLKVMGAPHICCGFAMDIFTRYSRHSNDKERFVIHMIHVLGARGSHLQRLKQRMCSSHGEIYEENVIEEIENILCQMIVDVFESFHELLINILQQTHSDGETTSVISEPGLLNYLASRSYFQDHLSSDGKSVPNYFSSSLTKVFKLYQQVCMLAPSVIYLLPAWISQLCPQLCVICISFSTSAFDNAQQAAAVLCHVVSC